MSKILVHTTSFYVKKKIMELIGQKVKSELIGQNSCITNTLSLKIA